jgi:hypothetical protein
MSEPTLWRRSDGCPSGCPDAGHYEGCEFPDFVRAQRAEARAAVLREVRREIDEHVPSPSNRIYYEEGYVDCRRHALAAIDRRLEAD